MTTIKLNSELFQIIDVGMYGTFLSPDSMFDNYQINSDFENGDFEYSSSEYWDLFNNNLYIKAVQKCAADYLNGVIESEDFDFKITVECGEIYSPKFYNYSNDRIDINVIFDKSKALEIAINNRDNFNSYLKENYSSRSGFISFTPDNFSDWYESFIDPADNHHDQAVSAVLTFVFKDDLQDEQSKFLEYCNERFFYSEFMDEPTI